MGRAGGRTFFGGHRRGILLQWTEGSTLTEAIAAGPQPRGCAAKENVGNINLKRRSERSGSVAEIALKWPERFTDRATVRSTIVRVSLLKTDGPEPRRDHRPSRQEDGSWKA